MHCLIFFINLAVNSHENKLLTLIIIFSMRYLTTNFYLMLKFESIADKLSFVIWMPCVDLNKILFQMLMNTRQRHLLFCPKVDWIPTLRHRLVIKCHRWMKTKPDISVARTHQDSSNILSVWEFVTFARTVISGAGISNSLFAFLKTEAKI